MSNPKNKDNPSRTGRSKPSGSATTDKQKTSNSYSKNAKIEDIRKTIDEELDLKKAKRIVPAEEKYVKRTAEEFEAGAVPMKTGSHRLENLNVRVTNELRSAIKDAIAEAGVTDAMWLRAALRKALREGVNVKFELETEIDLSKPKSERSKENSSGEPDPNP